MPPRCPFRLVCMLAIAGCSPAMQATTETCAVVEQTLFDRRIEGLWPLSDGSVVATRIERGTTTRSEIGVWSDDDTAPGFWKVVEGGGAQWGLGRTTVWRRTVTSDWVELGFESVPPLTGYTLTDIAAFGPTDVRVLGLRVFEDWESADGTPGYIEELDLAVFHWDGTAWSIEVVEDVPGGTRTAALLSDGRLVLAARGEAWFVEGNTRTRIDALGMNPASMLAQDDGTLLIVGEYGNGLWVGDEEGFRARRPPVGRVSAARVTGNGDVWVAASDDDDHRIWVYDDSWTSVYRGDHPILAMAEFSHGEMLFAGGQSGTFAVAGTRDGLSLDRAEVALDGIDDLTADDVTGEAWALGKTFVARSDGGPFVPEPLEPSDPLLPFAVSDSRFVHVARRLSDDPYQLVVHEPDGRTDVHTLDAGQAISVVCGSDGVLFAWGLLGESLRGFRNAGGAWESLGEVMSGGGTSSCWADSPDEVFVAPVQGEEGLLIRWTPDGTSELASIPGTPRWLSRMGDERLWMLVVQDTGFRQAELWAWDGATLEAQPDIPAGRAMHLAPDGELWAVESGDGPDTLHRRDADGDWSVLSEGGVTPLVGWGHQMWAARTSTQTWRRDCGGP